MTQARTLVKCLVWYVVALLVVSPPYFVFGIFRLFRIPIVLGVVLLMHLGLIGLAATAIYGSKPKTRHVCHLVFCWLLVLEVCATWLALVLLIILFVFTGPGPYNFR
jgi:hypothetical protein